MSYALRLDLRQQKMREKNMFHNYTHTRTHGCTFPHYARQLSRFVVSPSLLIEYNSLCDTIQPANLVF